MSPFLSTLKSSSRAAIVAVSLAAATLTGVATPAAAQEPSFKFDFGISGGNENQSFQKRGGGGGGGDHWRECLTNREIRRGLRRAGFDDIEFVDERGRRVKVVAEWERNDRLYSMWIHRCSGRVSDIERVRRHRNGGFGLQFQFGN